jgi:hypothetical protein
MAEKPAYAVVGNGYWAARMRAILAEAHRVSRVAGARRAAEETSSGYKERLSQALAGTGAQVAWICVPPGPHIPAIAEAVLEAGLHVIVEKPWLNSRQQSEALLETARRKGLVLGVHYEYCLLEAVENWRRDFDAGAGLEFGGCFTMSRADRLGIDATENLGSHLLAIRQYAAPQARVAEIRCAYQMADERQVWLQRAGRAVARADFWENREPIIQRFVEAVERAIGGAAFAFGLDFALRVAEAVEALKSNAPTDGQS